MITLRPYTPDLHEQWDHFVAAESRNGTFLHWRAFFDHNPANAADDASLLFYKDARLAAVLPAALRSGDAGRVLSSHPRSTYGGLVISDEIRVKEALECVDLLIGFAREREASEIVVRNPFRIFHATPCDEVDFALWHKGFSIGYRELEVAIPLEGFTADADTILARFDQKTRNQVRKAAKSGVEVRQSEDLPAFWEVLERSLRERHGVSPVHTHEQMARLRALVGVERVPFFGAYHGGALIAGMLMFVPNARAVHAQYIGSLPEHAERCPVNAIIAEVTAWAIRGGYKYLNLGNANENGGRDVNLGLYKFKEGFGARGVLRETMSLRLSVSPAPA